MYDLNITVEAFMQITKIQFELLFERLDSLNNEITSSYTTTIHQ